MKVYLVVRDGEILKAFKKEQSAHTYQMKILGISKVVGIEVEE